MARPRLSVAVTLDRLESEVLDVFREALGRLAGMADLPRAEEPINLDLYWAARAAHLEFLRTQRVRIPFSIVFDSTSQPEPDDLARSARLRKRPDFNCLITNPQAVDHLSSQINYYLECKRLGQAEGTWVLNENYSEHGINRFVHPDWEYAKGCRSGVMIGYLQNMTPSDVLAEVNTGATSRKLPSLALAAAGWIANGVTDISQTVLTRGFGPSPFSLCHLWVDVRHVPLRTAPPATAAPTVKKPAAKKKPKKATPAASSAPTSKRSSRSKKQPGSAGLKTDAPVSKEPPT